MQHSGRVNCFNKTYTFYWGEMFVSIYDVLTNKKGRKTAEESENALLFQADARHLVAKDQKERRAIVRQLIAARMVQGGGKVFVISEAELRELESLRLEVKRLRQEVLILKGQREGSLTNGE